MVQVQLRAMRAHSTVLTRELVARKDVETTVAHLAPRNAIVPTQGDHPGHAERTSWCPDPFRVGRQLAPSAEVERLVFTVHRQGSALVDEGERAPDRRDVNREVRAVQDEDGLGARKAYQAFVTKWTSLSPAVARSLEEAAA